MPEPKLFLIDAHALCYRSYFAIRGLATSKGQATNAVYGFVNTLKKILKEYDPEYMAVCFDVGKKTHRQERYAEYKIQRPSMPDDLVTQIPIIKEIVQAYHLSIFELEGFEADDVIATLAHKAPQEGVQVVIVSDDKDMFQLVNEDVKVFSARKDQMFGYKDAQERLGIKPEHIVDLIGLAGDKVDNIPGVMGIGEVTARNLINDFGSLEDVFKNIDKVKSAKVREKLLEQKEIAVFSKELSMLDLNVPISFDLKKMKVKDPDAARLFEMFKDLEFRKFAQEMSGNEAPAEELDVKAAASPSQIKTLSQKIEKNKMAAFLLDRKEDAEGYCGLVISMGSGEVFIVDKKDLGGLKPIFEDKEIIKITHNIKDCMKLLAESGCGLRGKMFDVMLAGYLLAPAHNSYDVENLAWTFLKTSDSLKDKTAYQASCLYKMYEPMKEELKERELLDLFMSVEMPLAYVLFRMESEGVLLDSGLLKDMAGRCEKEIAALEKKLYNLAGMEFNLNSPKQLSHVLFEKLKLPVIKKTKTGFSTNEEVLTKLAPKHELPEKILEYRQFAKLKSTYIDALPKLVNEQTGRLHASFNQTVTETGRLSSSNPNLQNIPIRTDLGKEIRRAFIASKKENVIVAADYSQIELRVLAHMSKDPNLIKAFEGDQDIHRFTASLMFDVKEKDVTAKMRDSAKRVNFGIIYGMSAYGLSKDLKIAQGEAQEFIDKYFLRYPKVKKFMDKQIKFCEEKGYVVTLLNRRRYIPEINNQNINVKQFAERQAINTPVQGSAADLIKLAMINIQEEIETKKLGSKMIITVHDELVFDVPKKEEQKVLAMVSEKMENVFKLAVPVKVDIKVGKNWLDAKKVK